MFTLYDDLTNLPKIFLCQIIVKCEVWLLFIFLKCDHEFYQSFKKCEHEKYHHFASIWQVFSSYMHICSFPQCEYWEVRNVSMGFSKSLMPKTHQITCLRFLIWQDFLALVIWKNPYSHFLLTVCSNCYYHNSEL